MRDLDPQNSVLPLTLLRAPQRVRDEFDELVSTVNRMQKKSRAALTELAESEQRFNAIADYHGDGHRFAEGTTKPQNNSPENTR